MNKTCKCQDSTGRVCGKEMTPSEVKQDGMCQHCADNVWEEIASDGKHIWTHQED